MLLDLDDHFEIDNACNVDEGFTKIEMGEYDVVVCDYEMPQKDGLQLLKALRQQNNKIPFILFTGKGREEVAIRALNLGADGYINKQGNPETVYGELSHCITQNVNRKNNEKLLRETETRFQSLFSTMNEGFCLHELVFDEFGKAVDYIILDVNKAYESILGLKRKEVIGKKASEVYGSNDAPYIEVYSRVAQNREPAYFETYFSPIKKDFSISVFSSEKNKFATVFTDISERRRLEKSLRESESNYRNLIDGMTDSAWVIDFNGNFVDINAAAAKTLGYSNQELLKMSVNEIDTYLKPVQIENLIKNLNYVDFQTFETFHTTKNGQEIPVEISSSLIIYRGKKAILSIARNISERKKVEAQLKNYNEILERVGEGVDAGLAVIDKDYQVVWANKRLMSLGVAPNKKCYETFNYLGIVCPDCGVEEIFQNDSPLDVREYKVVNPKGEASWIELRVTPLKNSNGVTIAALELAVPITERKKIENSLKISEAKYRAISEMMADVVFSCVKSDGNNFKIDWMVGSVEKIFGCSFEDFKKQGCWKHLVNIEDLSIFEEKVVGLKPGESTNCELRIVRGDGSTKWLKICSRADLDDINSSVHRIIGACEDITAKKKAEIKFHQTLLETETREKEITAFLNSTRTILNNEEFDIVAQKIFEDCKNLIGATVGFVSILSEADSENKVLFLNSEGLSHSSPTLPMPINELIEIARKTNRVIYENDFCMSDWMQFMPKGHSKIKNVMFVPLVISGKTVGLIGLSNKPSDFTERDALLGEGFGEYAALALNNSLKITEIENQKKNLKLLNEKLRVVGSLTRHDVANKLMVVKANFFLLKKRIGDNPGLVKYLESIDLALTSSDAIFDFSRLYERVGVEKPSEENVYFCFNQACNLLPLNVSVKIVNDCQGVVVVADSLLKQLFYNFLDNSFEHGEKVTKIRLHYSLENNEMNLFYEDDGVGVPDENKCKLFEAGFTTGKGSGLGLNLIRKMMDVYGWTISEEGKSGEGVKFKITIPKANNAGKKNFQITL